MHILFLSIVTSLGYLLLCYKILGARRLAKWATTLDILFTVCIPWLFAGSFDGMALAIIAGILFTLESSLFKLIYFQGKQ